MSDETMPQAGVMHPVDEAFLRVARAERDYERERADRLQRERDAALRRLERVTALLVGMVD